MSKLVYISGPISQGDTRGHVRRATELWAILRREGYSAWCPHWSQLAVWAFPELLADVTHAQWLANDLPFIQRFDRVIRIPGPSVGADKEVAEALTRGVHVFDAIYDRDQFIRLEPRGLEP